MRVLARSICFVLAACVVLTGCGPADREDALIETSDRFHVALEKRDGAAACAELTQEVAETLERQEKRPCPVAVLELDLPAGARASGADVDVLSGFADLPGPDVAFLADGPDGWKVSAAGCTPSSPDRPYDCVLGG